MKNASTLLVFSILIINSASAQTTWKVLSAPRNPNEYTVSSFINDDEGWLIDNTSVLWHTTNGCLTLDTLATGINFTKLQFISPLTGYALNAGNVYKTTDGGISWSTLTMPGSFQQTIYFLNKDTGFVSGFYQYYRTTDGGSSWSVFPMPGLVRWTDYFFINDSVGCATTDDYYNSNEIYRTTDCGVSWTGVFPDDESKLSCIYFSSKDSGWAGGYHSIEGGPEIVQTSDGGLTWQVTYVDMNFMYYPCSDIRAKKNNKEVFGVSQAFFEDVMTIDGGDYWDYAYDFDTLSFPLWETDFARTLGGDENIYLSGKYGTLLKWGKDTAQWQDLSGRIVSDINALSFTTASEGWIGSGCGILKTVDGGATWSAAGNIHKVISMIDAPDDSLVLACENYLYGSHFYRTTNAGQTWNKIDTATLPYKMFALELDMVNPTTGYILSGGWYNNYNGTVWKTTDGGINWTGHYIANGGGHWSMYFLNANEGWVVQSNNPYNWQSNDLFHTSDGGITWTNIYNYTGSAYQFANLFFLDSQHGYLVTSGSNYYETSDGGITWTAKSIPGASNYLKVFFADSLNGWFLTKNDIYGTVDGGATWTNVYHSETELYDMKYSGGSLFARGFYGFLVKGFTPAPCEASFTLTADTATQGLYYGYNLSTGTDLSYSWDWGDGSTSTGQFPTHTYADSGWYNICLSIYDNYNGCTDTFCLNFYIMKTDGEMGIHQIIFVNGAVPTQSTPDESMEINISPNPFSGSTSIELSLSQSADVTIKLFDLQGRKIRAVASQGFSEGKNEITLKREGLGAGIYFLQFKTSSETVTQKLVLE